jgi:hypothetical protein
MFNLALFAMLALPIPQTVREPTENPAPLGITPGSDACPHCEDTDEGWWWPF